MNWSIECELNTSILIVAFGEYCENVCSALKLEHLDGNERVDGYSLRSVHNAFRLGVTAGQYADFVRQAWARKRAVEMFNVICDDGDPHFIPVETPQEVQ